MGAGRSWKNLARALPSLASKAAVRSAPTSSAACLSRSGLRPVRTTSAPSARARRAVSNPMPALPPITTTVCPASSGWCRTGTGRLALVMIPPLDRSGAQARTGSRVLWIVVRIHVFKADRADGGHLSHVRTGFCPVEVSGTARQDDDRAWRVGLKLLFLELIAQPDIENTRYDRIDPVLVMPV